MGDSSNLEIGCSGDGLNRWTPEDIQEIPCPSCQNPVEIWKDEAVVKCNKCGGFVQNPRHPLNREKA